MNQQELHAVKNGLDRLVVKFEQLDSNINEIDNPNALKYLIKEYEQDVRLLQLAMRSIVDDLEETEQLK